MFNDGKQMKFKGTVSYLTEYFAETIKKGKKHESEEGHVFVNESPTDINELIDTLNNAAVNIVKDGGAKSMKFEQFYI